MGSPSVYWCPKGVPSINKFTLVRHFDFYRQRALWNYKVWLSNPATFVEYPRWQAGRQMACCFPLLPSQKQSSPPLPSSRQGQPSGSHAVSELGCTLPLYRQRRGNPSVRIFSVHIPKHYRQTHRFQLWFTGLPLPGPVTRLGPCLHSPVTGWVWVRVDLREPCLLSYRSPENGHRRPGQPHLKTERIKWKKEY